MTSIDGWMLRRLLARYGTFLLCDGVADELEQKADSLKERVAGDFWRASAGVLRDLFSLAQKRMRE